MESPIRFAKLIGGDEDAETILVGLKNGQTLKVFVDNSFPTMLVKLNSPIRSLDLNCMRTLLAVVDENNILKVFNLTNKNEILFQENSVTAAVWNTDFEDMIAYSTTNNVLNIKTSTLPAFQQTMRGTVIGFKANRLFNLHNGNLTIVDIPHSHALYHYIEAKDFDKAYSIASRGVAEVDWKMLGLHAMTEMNLDIARKAFTQIREVKFVELLHALELNRRQAGDSKEKEELLLADILAFQGKYSDAARKFIKCNNEPRAIEMYCDLKMWDEAKKVCSDEKLLKNLIRQQAHWSEDSENYVEAASLYEACGDFAKAISMMGQGGQVEKLLATCRKLPKSEVALISECAHYFKQFNNIPYAIEAFEKVGDNRSLIQIYVDAGDWKNAFTIIEKCPQYAREVYVPWAGWLGENDMFEEALEAFRAARWPKEAIRMMETLASNSVVCRKFRDAAFYLIHLADEYGTFDDGTEPSEALKAARILLSKNCVRRGEIYYAFSTIFTSATQPFVFNEMVLFRQAKYVLAMVSEGNVPMNVGKAEILYTLGRVAGRLEMIRTARVVFEKLQTVILPLNIMEQVDVETLILRSRNFTDREDLLDTCYRCKQVVPQLTNAGDRCPNCYHPFVRCFVTFTALPLVELAISNDLTDEEAERIIVSGIGGSGKAAAENEVNEDGTAVEKAGNEWQAADTGANVINFEDDNLDYQIDQQLIAMGRTKATANKTGDPFFAQLQFITRPGKPKDVYQPFMVNAEMLKGFRRDEIFIVKQSFGDLQAPNRYYRLMNRDFSITLCKGCQHFFIGDDYEKECMKGNGCPLCRFKPSRQVNRSLKEIMLATEMESGS
ncbi:putative WD40 repeat protein [Strigomonas culicis]|uniref:Putative WD40 repeat protein n=1 Tax=Strigomonas culicis TaxID=28005 RepID=S9VGV2_9TRYP|nr:putative WD40 repeat protein [Strigomonas culicis]|eukprot:EPY26261.1 putative WD40 repeat protein [Strigomonas culicis]